MKVKRQEQIMAFLIEEFGQDRGSALFDKQEQLFHSLIKSENTGNKSKSQQKTLIQTILPCVVLYKTLLQEGFSEEETSAYLQKYMFTIVGANMHSSMAKWSGSPASSSFTAVFSGRSCAPPTCMKVHRITPALPSM